MRSSSTPLHRVGEYSASLGLILVYKVLTIKLPIPFLWGISESIWKLYSSHGCGYPFPSATLASSQIWQANRSSTIAVKGANETNALSFIWNLIHYINKKQRKAMFAQKRTKKKKGFPLLADWKEGLSINTEICTMILIRSLLKASFVRLYQTAALLKVQWTRESTGDLVKMLISVQWLLCGAWDPVFLTTPQVLTYLQGFESKVLNDCLKG